MKKENAKFYRNFIIALTLGGITFGTSSLLGYTPFYKDKTIQKEDVLTKIDSDGKVTRQETFDVNRSAALVEHYSKWRKDDNGYIRDVDYYIPEKYDVESLKRIVDSGEFINPTYSTTESVKTLSNDELEQNEDKTFAYMMENDKNYVVVKESDTINNLTTSAAIATYILLILGVNELDNINTKRRIRKK